MIVSFLIMIIAFLLASILGRLSVENIIDSAVSNVFQIEKLIDGIFTDGYNILNKLIDFTLFISVSIILLKFLKKGFEIYVMGSDGDSTENPVFLIVNLMRSVIALFIYRPLIDQIALIFDKIMTTILVYADFAVARKKAEITKINAEKVLETLSKPYGNIQAGIDEFINGLFPNGLDFMVLLLWLIFLIIVTILYVKLLAKGVEIYILKIGLPLSFVGLMDNDKGIFKDYSLILLQAFATIIVQVFLMKLSVVILYVGKLDFLTMVICISLSVFALNVPNILSKFLITGRGSGSFSGLLSSARMLLLRRR